MQSIEQKYGELLVDYCLEIKPGDRLYVRSSMLGEPLVREVYRSALKRGGHVEMDFSFEGQNQIFYEHANGPQLEYAQTTYEKAVKEFDAFLFIRAPYNLREDQDIDREKRKKRTEALADLQHTYMRRTGDGSMCRSLCQYPTSAAAQQAGMSLEDYRSFVYHACMLDREDPAAAWREVRANQQRIVDYLNQASQVSYQGANIDVTFSVKDRTWINSDGRANMPSGEVFTGPVEDSVNGRVTFTYPSIYMGNEVQQVSLDIKNGEVIKWDAAVGKQFLDEIFQIPGARYFGEVAIGTNYNIQRATGNILFDEKIGGTIHMAIGQSYFHTGGKNQSSIHWDMITDMKEDGRIYADGKLIYENGKFLI